MEPNESRGSRSVLLGGGDAISLLYYPAVQSAIAARDAEAEAVEKVSENPNTGSLLKTSYEKIIKEIENNKKAAAILTKLGITGLAVIEDFVFNTDNLFYDDGTYSDLPLETRQNIHLRSLQLTADQKTVSQCKLTLNALFEDRKTALCKDNYTCITDNLFDMIELGSHLQLVFNPKDTENNPHISYILEINRDYSLNFTMKKSQKEIRSYSLGNSFNLNSYTIQMIAEKMTSVDTTIDKLENLHKIVLEKKSNLEDIGLEEIYRKIALLKFKDIFDLDLTKGEINFLDVRKVGNILTLTIKVGENTIILSLSQSYLLWENMFNIKTFKSKVLKYQKIFLKNFDISNKISFALKDCNCKILSEDNIKQILPTQIVVNSYCEKEVLKIFFDELKKLPNRERKCILIHGIDGSMKCVISFEKKSDSEFIYRVFGAIDDESIKINIIDSLIIKMKATGTKILKTEKTSITVIPKSGFFGIGNKNSFSFYKKNEIIVQALLEGQTISDELSSELGKILLTKVSYVLKDYENEAKSESFIHALLHMLDRNVSYIKTDAKLITIQNEKEKNIFKSYSEQSISQSPIIDQSTIIIHKSNSDDSFYSSKNILEKKSSFASFAQEEEKINSILNDLEINL